METLTRRRLGLLGAGLGLGAALGAGPAVAGAMGSKPALGLERLLDAVYRDGELLTTYRFNAAIAWAGSDRLVFASPRWRTHPQILTARLGDLSASWRRDLRRRSHRTAAGSPT